jgi:hypothetical protein
MTFHARRILAQVALAAALAVLLLIVSGAVPAGTLP